MDDAAELILRGLLRSRFGGSDACRLAVYFGRPRIDRASRRIAIVAALAAAPILGIALSSCRGVDGTRLPAEAVPATQAGAVGAPAETPQSASIRQMMSPDTSIRRAAAASLDPWTLSSAELRLQASIFAGDAEWLREHFGGAWEPPSVAPSLPVRQSLAIGHRECIAAVTTLIDAARPETAEADVRAVRRLSGLAWTADIPALIALLRTCGEALRRPLADTLFDLAERTRFYRVDLARAALEEAERDRSGADSAHGAAPAPTSGAAGFAPEWRRLAAIAWELPGRRPAGRAESCGLGDQWLRRWARDVQPGEVDLPVLAQIAGLYSESSPWADRALAPERSPCDTDRAWAVRQIGRVAGPSATSLLHQFSRCGDAERLTAQGTLVRRGESADLGPLVAAANSRDEALAGFGLIALWDAAPTAARSVVVERSLAGTMDALTPWPDGSYPTCREADRIADELGVVISPDDLRWIGDELLRRGASPVTVFDHFAGIARLGFGRPVAVELASLLPTAADSPERRRTGDSESVVAVLAAIEAADPDVLRDLLRHWTQTATDASVVSDLTRWRTRIGDRRDDPRPTPVARGWPDYGTPAPDPDVDAAGAGDAATIDIAELGLRPDPRARDVLQRIRGEKNPASMWPAVLGLARSGDADARAEWRTLVRDGRSNLIADVLGRIRIDVVDDQETLEAWLECLAADGTTARLARATFLWQEPQQFSVFPASDDEFSGDPAIDIDRIRRLVGAGGLRRSRVSGALLSPSGERAK